jgi:two-component system, chemotaxis family, CheB/CheR fusion protein
MAENNETEKEKEKTPHEDAGGEKPASKDFDSRFPIVGIGASAGGVHALEAFFKKMPNDCGMAFVVIQHLSTEYESHMKSVLTRHTEMEVIDTNDGMVLEPNRVYLNRPGVELEVRSRTLHARESSKDRGMIAPIDVLFRSLAEDLKEFAICVVLSGANADGTQGAKAVKGQGGLVVVQEPGEASHARMPKSVIEAGIADLVLPVESISEVILRYVGHPFIQSLRKTEETEETEETEGQYQKQIQSILTIVQKHTGHDFSEYKHNTIRRRIQRRMAMHQIQKMSEYRRFLRQDSDEVQELFRDLTVTVTGFFRDAEAFTALKEKALIPMMKKIKENGQLRVWVAGCATGEEAYTLAMILLETMEELDKYLEVKVFASDINDKAIRAARSGIYPRGITADLPEDRLKRFFTQKNDHYQVDSKIRDMVVFADHNLLRDPPFSNVHLISCRNLLIYMEPALQKKVFPLLSYALKPGGYLFLGTSESVGENSGYFQPVDKRLKIFKRGESAPSDIPQVQHQAGPWATGRIQQPEGDAKKHGWGKPLPDVRSIFESTITQKYARSAVLIDQEDTIRFFYGDTGRYLSFPQGEPDLEIFKMVSGQLHYRLTQGVDEVREEGRPFTREEIPVRRNGSYLEVKLHISPVDGSGHQEGWLLIEFEETEPPETGESEEAAEGETTDSEEKAELERKLRHTRQELQAAVEELETSMEDLKSSNEELQANNEELQSTNEELESSKEELQSTNEELETVNSELQQKNQELEKAENDMRNIFSAVENAIILLDDDLRIKRFTPSATRIFKLKDVDMGRKLSDITSHLEYDRLETEVEAVLDNLERKEATVESRDQKIFQMRIAPYRTAKNVIEGVVLSFYEITSILQSERQTRDLTSLLEEIISTLWEPILVLDEALNIQRASPEFFDLFETTADETLDHEIYALGDSQWDIPELRRFLEEIIPKQKEFKGYVVEHEFPAIGRRKMSLTARKIHSGEQRQAMILMGFKDVTDAENGEGEPG